MTRARRRTRPRSLRGPRLRPRRGALVVYLGVFISATIVLGALTFDLSRLANLKAELQTSADAGAHAGMQRYIVSADSAQAAGTGLAYAMVNLAMLGTVTVDSSDVGHWNGASYAAGGLPLNAVRVEVSRQSSGLFMSLIGVSAPRVRAQAIATSVSYPRSPLSVPCAPSCAILVR